MIPTGKGVEANQRMAVRRVGTPVDIHRKGRLLSRELPKFRLGIDEMRAPALRFCIISGVFAYHFQVRKAMKPLRMLLALLGLIALSGCDSIHRDQIRVG